MDGWNFEFFISNTQVKITQSKRKSQSVEPNVEYKGRVLKEKKPTPAHHTIQMSANIRRHNVNRRKCKSLWCDYIGTKSD